MSYAQMADVIALVGRLQKSLSATSTPSLADLETFLVQRANQLDSVLASRGILTPVILPNASLAAMGELVRLNAQGAAADALLAAFGVPGTSYADTGAVLLRSYEATIGAWVKGEGIPVGLATVEADLAVRSAWSGTSADPWQRPLFSRDRWDGGSERPRPHGGRW